MNNGNAPTNFNLPPPVPGGLENMPAAAETASPQGDNTPAARPESAASPTPIAPPMAIPAITPVSVPTNDASSTTGSTPAIADDSDLIEKEWVLKAKQIVEKTKDNPYQQNKEMTVVKADYLKKRYNKTIKLSE